MPDVFLPCLNKDDDDDDDCASVFSKSIAKATFSFPYVLDPAFDALYRVYEVRRRAGDVMPYTFLFGSSEESVRRGSFFKKTARFTPSSVTTERSRCQGGGGGVVVVCGVVFILQSVASLVIVNP